jgi:hypothetical protein
VNEEDIELSVADGLKKLEELAPVLNRTVDSVINTFHEADRMLQSLAIGLPAFVRISDSDDVLAYRRHGRDGVYHIVILTPGPDLKLRALAPDEAPREQKLQAITALKPLLTAIVRKGMGLSDRAEAAAVIVSEWAARP